MFYALTWLLVSSLIALWSLSVWALHAITAWSVANVGVLTGGTGTLQDIRVPDWLAPWIPPGVIELVASMTAPFAPVITALLERAPALTDGLSVMAWVLWACGTVVLVLMGLALSGLIAVLRRNSSGKPALANPANAGS